MASTATTVSIGAVVKATGVGEATLRAWERRFGFPDPQREPSGHRRYSEADIDRVRAVLRLRDDGLTLRQAIAQVLARERPSATSVFARLREVRPDLAAPAIRSRHMARLSRAVEEEVGALAEPGLLIGAFQHEAAYRRSQPRWNDLVRDGRQSFVLADFPKLKVYGDRPTEVPGAGSGPMASEWVLVSVGVGSRACLIGRERPGQEVEDGARIFDAFLSLEPEVVEAAAQAAIDLAEPHAPEVAAAAQRLLDEAIDPDPAAQLRLSGAITSRFVAAFA
jgi:MerR family transcriptional regulator, light-induced transcriptional regulator